MFKLTPQLLEKLLNYLANRPWFEVQELISLLTNLEKYEKSLKIHKENNLEKVRARKILNYHVNVGNMTKPIFCSNCQEKTKIEAHHENYLKPLDIIWLCRQCHKLIHRKYKD